MKQWEKVFRTWRKAVKTLQNISLPNSQPFVSFYSLSEYLSEQPQRQPLRRPAKRQDALVSKASARAVSTALRMECVDNVDESFVRRARVTGGWGWREDRAFPPVIRSSERRVAMENGERVARWLVTSCADVSRYTINYYIHIMYPVPMLSRHLLSRFHPGKDGLGSVACFVFARGFIARGSHSMELIATTWLRLGHRHYVHPRDGTSVQNDVLFAYSSCFVCGG